MKERFYRNLQKSKKYARKKQMKHAFYLSILCLTIAVKLLSPIHIVQVQESISEVETFRENFSLWIIMYK
jgi:hypothetical protein